MTWLTADGLQIKTLTTIRDEMVGEIRGQVDPALNLSSPDPMGQVIGIVASKIRELWEALSEINAQDDPDQAEGARQDSVGALRGIPRNPATYSTVVVSLTTGVGLNAAIGDITLHVDGYPDRAFQNAEPVVYNGTSPRTIDFQATDTGPVAAPAGTLTEIVGTVPGLTAATNGGDATLGEDIELDTPYQLRSETEMRASGSGNIDAIAASVAQIDGVISAKGYENISDTIDPNGLPPGSIEIVIWDGDAEDADNDTVAYAIWSEKGTGCRTYGNVTGLAATTVRNYNIKFSRAIKLEVYIDVQLSTEAGWAAETDLKEAISEWGNAHDPSETIYYNQLLCMILDYPGVIDVLSLEIGLTASPTGMVNLPSVVRSIYRFATARITVT